MPTPHATSRPAPPARPPRGTSASALGADFVANADAIVERAVHSLFQTLNSLCEGCIAIDAQARIIWINAKYLAMLGLASADEALGREIEEVIPNSLMRQVVRSGQPILLDIMDFGAQSFVVTRMPLLDEAGNAIGAIGFVLYDRPEYLKPLVAKFTRMQHQLNEAQRKLALDRRPRYTLSSFVGQSPACLEVKRQARRAAQQDTTVLLLGETGTGKEMLAHAIHATSDRARHPFIAINVAAVPDNLLEAEFFGAAPGAYTGADKKGRDGKFKIADGGTLFLDEIGDMPLSLQAKLLRVLQDQEFEPLGSNTMCRVDVRIIAATRVDLKQLVSEGRFRADLYYRLNVLPIVVPPLRERLADLDVLCECILEQIAQRTGVHQREIDPAAVAALAACEWPGNVRELRNVLERAAMLTDAPLITPAELEGILSRPVTCATPPSAVRPYGEALAEFERSTLRAAVESCGGHVPRAAQVLGLSRATLYKKLAHLKGQSHF